ncbi:MAG: 4-hydroxy-tetrahydrodipicolinate reductase [Phycisphaerae bacterium]
MTQLTRIAIIGAAGRMGRRIAALAIESEQFDIVAATENPSTGQAGKDVGELAGVGKFGLAVTDSIPDDVFPEVAIDFSLPEGTLAVLPICRKKNTAMVIGTTGLTESQQAEVADSASQIPIIHASNYSVGINVLLKVVSDVTAALGKDYDIDISETHHRFKKDAPSGTAISLARSVCQARGVDYGEVAVLGRGGQSPRKPGEIGMHALRLGDTVGEHQVHFGNLGETVTIAHSAHTRDTFVRGALRAAKWLAGKKPGMYDMPDVLGL